MDRWQENIVKNSWTKSWINLALFNGSYGHVLDNGAIGAAQHRGLYHMRVQGCPFICISGMADQCAACCTATDRRSSLHACQRFPCCFIVVPCPFVIVPWHLVLIFVPLHSLLTPPLSSLDFYETHIYYAYSMSTIHIIEMPTLRAQKKCAAMVHPHLAPLLRTWNLPGSHCGLPGGWRDRKEAHICNQSSLTSSGSADAQSGDTGGIFAFCHRFPAAWGALGWCLCVPDGVLLLGALRRRNVGGVKMCFCTWHCSEQPGHIYSCRGVII